MKKIEVKILNPEAISNAKQMMVTAARLTQKGEKIACMDNFMALYNKSYTENTAKIMSHLPHPTIQKFAVINVVIVGASRRYLAQITRHQNEVKFMSASLQYSDYSDDNDFAIPYNIIAAGKEEEYITANKAAMDAYKKAVEVGIDNDSAGYMAPQGLRNVLIMSATPYQWKHMISQRTCRRNTPETRIVMLKIWEELYRLDPVFFAPDTTGAFCQKDKCLEGKMSCCNPLDKTMTPYQILRKDFPLLYEDTDIQEL